MATDEQLKFNAPHPPKENALEAFTIALPKVKSEILKSRAHWDAHEAKMWARASGISDKDLVTFTLEDDLVLVSSASTSYGTILLGKIRLPSVTDEEHGEGFVHVRLHDPPSRGKEDVVFHSLFTDEGGHNADGKPTTWNAIQSKDKPLEFFHE